MKKDNTGRSSRLVSIDLLRGILVVLMALDHANYHIAQQHSTGEYWGGSFPQYASSFHFLTRFVTHFCAPGFFFLMGMGMVLFSSSRQKQGWRMNQIRRHFFLRGLLLVTFQILIVFLGAWSIGPAPAPRWYIGVLAALGAGMILCIPLLEVKPAFLYITAGVFFLGLELLTPKPELWGRAFDNIFGVLFVYSGGSDNFWVNYPLAAWLEVILLGMAIGKRLESRPEDTDRLALSLGILFLFSFLGLRWVNGFGNIRPYQFNDWTDFLNLVKYPPSMTFILLTMGVNLILLGLFIRIDPSEINKKNPLMVFGRVPLFAYVGHIFIYLVIGKLLTPEGSSLLVMYGFWLVGLLLLYWPSRWYGIYKTTSSSKSFVRFF